MTHHEPHFSDYRQLRNTNSGDQWEGFADESFTRDEIKEMNFRKLSRIRSGFREMNTKIPKISIIIPGKMISTVKITVFNRFYEISPIISQWKYNIGSILNSSDLQMEEFRLKFSREGNFSRGFWRIRSMNLKRNPMLLRYWCLKALPRPVILNTMLSFHKSS